MKISWILLTYNRLELVDRSMEHNQFKAGKKWDELIWVDNGSEEDVKSIAQKYKADVFISYPKNQGVAVGYNTAMRHARGDLIVITGCDMLMPNNWLEVFYDSITQIPNIVCSSIYSIPHEKLKERYTKGPTIQTVSRINYIEALGIGRRIFKRSLLEEIGYLREDFGLYGWEDVEWAYRLKRYCNEKKKLSIVLTDHLASHLQNEKSYLDSEKMNRYTEWKLKEVEKGKSKMHECNQKRFPFYCPY